MLLYIPSAWIRWIKLTFLNGHTKIRIRFVYKRALTELDDVSMTKMGISCPPIHYFNPLPGWANSLRRGYCSFITSQAFSNVYPSLRNQLHASCSSGVSIACSLDIKHLSS